MNTRAVFWGLGFFVGTVCNVVAGPFDDIPQVDPYPPCSDNTPPCTVYDSDELRGLFDDLPLRSCTRHPPPCRIEDHPELRRMLAEVLPQEERAASSPAQALTELQKRACLLKMIDSKPSVPECYYLWMAGEPDVFERKMREFKRQLAPNPD